MIEKPELIFGGIGVDDRGDIRFVNNFKFENVKRFYQISNFSLDLVRAFHGHKKEEKFVYVVKGSIIIAIVEFDDDKKPRKDNKIYRYILSDKNPTILRIPSGFANGFKSLEEDTRIIFFSTSSLEDSKEDDYRFPYDYWGKEIWEVESR